MDKIITATGLQQFRELLEGRFEIKNKDNSEQFGGMGKETLQRNIQGSGNNAKNVLDQTNLPIIKSNYIFKIEDDFDLDGRTVIVPQGSILDFEGGSIKNGQLKLNATKFDGQVKLGSDIRFSEYQQVDLSSYTAEQLKNLNPKSNYWYVLNNGEYIYTSDESVQNGTTYFNKVGLNGTCANEVFEQSWFENNDVDAFLDFASYVDSTSDSICLNFQPGLYNPTVKCEKFNTSKTIIINGNSAVLRYSANALKYKGFSTPIFHVECQQNYVGDRRRMIYAAKAGDSSIYLDNVAGLNAGDFIILRDTNTSSFDYTRNYQQGEVAKIKSIDTVTRQVMLDNNIFGNYVNLGQNNGSDGCVVFKCEFNKFMVNNLTMLAQSGMTGKNNTIGIQTKWSTFDFNNLVIKDFDKCCVTYNAINSSLTNCVLNSRPGDSTLGDGYGIQLNNVQNVNINGGDYRGRNHGIATGESYGAKWNALGRISEVVYEAFVCRWIFINNVYAKGYRNVVGINTHAGAEYVTVSSCIGDGVTLGGSKYMVSSNVFTDSITITSTQLDSHIVNNICKSITYKILAMRKSANNAKEISFNYYTLDNTPENTLMIEGNTVYNDVSVLIEYAKLASMYLYSLDGNSAVNHVYDRIQSEILEQSEYYKPLFDSVRSLYNNGVSLRNCINQVLDILTPQQSDSSSDVQTKREIFDNLIQDIFIQYNDNISKILTEGKIIISGNSFNNVTAQYDIFDSLLDLNSSTYYNKVEDMFGTNSSGEKVVNATFLRLNHIATTDTHYPDYENNLSVIVKNNVINQYDSSKIVAKLVFVENNIVRKSNNMPQQVTTLNSYTTIANNNTYVRALDNEVLTVDRVTIDYTNVSSAIINNYFNGLTTDVNAGNDYEAAALNHCEGFYYKTYQSGESYDHAKYPEGKLVYYSWYTIDVSNMPNKIASNTTYELLTRRTDVDIYFSKSTSILPGAYDETNAIKNKTEKTIDLAIETALANGTLVHGGSWRSTNYKNGDYYADIVTWPSLQEYPYMFLITKNTSVINLNYVNIITSLGGINPDRMLIGKFENAPSGDSLYPGVKYFCTDASNSYKILDAEGVQIPLIGNTGIEIVYTGSKWVDCFGRDVTFGSNTPEPLTPPQETDTDTNPHDDLDWED